MEATDGEPSATILRILDVIRRIPRGRVTTYGRIAEAVGLPGRARLVGHALSTSPLAGSVPWHRVVGANGRISDRPGDGAAEQRRRLTAEGVEVSVTGAVRLATFLWVPGRTKDPSSARRNGRR